MTDPTLPLLPLRDVVVFPGMPLSVLVGRPRSVAAVAAARERGCDLVVVAQRRGDVAHPGREDLYDVGTRVRVLQALRLPDGNLKVHLEGLARTRVLRFVEAPAHTEAVARELPDEQADADEVDALVRSVRAAVERYVKLNRAAPPDMLMGVNAVADPGRLADLLVGVLKLTPAERQDLLELVSVPARLERIGAALQNEVEFLQVERKLRSRVRRDRDQTEREAWLDDQMKVLQQEAGDRPERDELDELQKALASKPMTDAARERAERELRRLGQMNPMSAEATVVRSYLDWLLALPWVEEAEVGLDLKAAADALDTAHHGLQEVKERILEHLAAARLSAEPQGTVLCLVGPPGVGKTSLARAIADATGRPFARIALGGVRDEAEIRGHRRTYIGALPGRILQAMKRAGKINPLLLLDEVDKLSSDIRGDPSSALLEVLDPEQHAAFSDHYLDLDYDLSHVLFLCTANELGRIPPPLLDRLEVVEISGYTEAEKRSIATTHLLPKQRRRAGLDDDQLSLSDDALRAVIRRYTRESGVRSLERQLGRLARKLARRMLEDGGRPVQHVEAHDLEALLGSPTPELRPAEREAQVGVVQGLSVGPAGGELLAIEVAAVPGKGKLILTGRLGEVLKESASACFTYLRSRAGALGLDPDFHDTQDFHVHYPGVPSGVEGPSAGIAMATALVSALTGVPVRHDTALTGEITLRGRVLPVGGVREKVLAAHRAGLTRVLVPEANRHDLRDIPAGVRDDVEIVLVDHMDRVLREALVAPLAPLAVLSAGLDPSSNADLDEPKALT